MPLAGIDGNPLEHGIFPSMTASAVAFPLCTETLMGRSGSARC